MDYRIKTPLACTAGELTAFHTLLLLRGRVKVNNLLSRITHSKLLGFCYDKQQLVGIIALKHVAKNNIRKIFHQASMPALMATFRHELGWAYTKETHRQKGIANTLTQQLLSSLEKNNLARKAVFALVRVENWPARNLLEKYDFHQTGQPYPGQEADFVLYT